MNAFDTPEEAIAASGGTTERYHPGTPLNGERMNAQPDDNRWGGQDQRGGGGGGGSDFKPYRAIDPTELFGRAIPPRVWIVEDWLPVGHATANYGDGGVGKTLLAQQLMTSCATGLPWCGRDVMRCKSLGIFCEDGEDELHRRQDRINDALGLNFADLADMRWVSGIGVDNILMTFDPRGRGQLTERFNEVVRLAVASEARLLVIDTAADVFGGKENERAEVRQFIGHGLNSLAMAIDGAVLLNAHPSRSGMSSTGDMDGGSTAWSNTVRSRWSLSRPKADDDAEVNPDERVLTRRKANYAAAGESIRLRWVSGILAPVTPDGAVQGVGSRQKAEEVFLTLLDRNEAADRRVSDSNKAGNFAPKVFAKQPGAEGYSVKDFTRAMESLFGSGKLVMEFYGRTGDARQRIARAPIAAEPDADAADD